MSKLREKILTKKVVCPMPIQWNQLYDLLSKIDSNDEDKLLAPLILAAWGEPKLAKHARFLSHLEFAEKNGVIDTVDRFLSDLKDDQWLYF